MGHEQHVLDGTTCRDQPFGRFDVRIVIGQATDGQHQQRGAKGLFPRLFDLFGAGLGVPLDQGRPEGIGQAAARTGRNDHEPPGCELPMVGRSRR